MDNVVISDMFLYLIIFNLLKENDVLHAIQLWMIILALRLELVRAYQTADD